MTSTRAFMALLAGLALCGPATGREVKTFKDWMVGCDPANACTAIGLEAPSEEGAFMGAHLVITRPAGPDGAATMTVVLMRPEDGGTPRSITLAADGEDLTDALAVETSDYDIRAVVPAADGPAVIDAARRADGLVARLETDGGQTPAVISLAGASAALLYVDDVQGRVGTVTALARPGRAAAATVPPAPALATVAALSIAERDDATGPRPAGLPAAIPDDCSGPDPYIAFSVGEAAELWGVCTSAGAYNAFYDLYLVRDGVAVPAPLPPGSEAGPFTLVNPWVTETGTLGAFFRGRGVGDCGEITEHAFDGTRFVTLHRALMPDCRGVASDDWPVLDRALRR